jgi:hypothetical protein
MTSSVWVFRLRFCNHYAFSPALYYVRVPITWEYNIKLEPRKTLRIFGYEMDRTVNFSCMNVTENKLKSTFLRKKCSDISQTPFYYVGAAIVHVQGFEIS